MGEFRTLWFINEPPGIFWRTHEEVRQDVTLTLCYRIDDCDALMIQRTGLEQRLNPKFHCVERKDEERISSAVYAIYKYKFIRRWYPV